jgi:hypothetical protein
MPSYFVLIAAPIAAIPGFYSMAIIQLKEQRALSSIPRGSFANSVVNASICNDRIPE